MKGCEKVTTRMGKMIEQIWIRKPSKLLRVYSSYLSFGPDPRIAILASGLRQSRTQGLTEDRTRSHAQKVEIPLALRATTTETVTSKKVNTHNNDNFRFRLKLINLFSLFLIKLFLLKNNFYFQINTDQTEF
jgi:hypothetical protein